MTSDAAISPVNTDEAAACTPLARWAAYRRVPGSFSACSSNGANAATYSPALPALTVTRATIATCDTDPPRGRPALTVAVTAAGDGRICAPAHTACPRHDARVAGPGEVGSLVGMWPGERGAVRLWGGPVLLAVVALGFDAVDRRVPFGLLSTGLLDVVAHLATAALGLMVLACLVDAPRPPADVP